MLENLGSLITKNDQCLGHLMYFKDHGVFEPDMGRVDVSPQDAEIHNRLLDEALVTGLDANCEVGQCGIFYWRDEGGVIKITTFTGVFVANAVKNGNSITFQRSGKTFRGRIQKDADCFNFRRVA